MFAIFRGFCSVFVVANHGNTYKEVVIETNPTDKAKVLELFAVIEQMLRGSWSAKRGAVVSNAKGVERPLFDIIVPSGQLAGQPELGRIVLVAKAKGGIAPFRLLEQLESPYTHTTEGVALTTWRGELVNR